LLILHVKPVITKAYMAMKAIFIDMEFMVQMISNTTTQTFG